MSATGGAPVKSTPASTVSMRRYDETPEEGVRVTRYGGVADIIGAAPTMSTEEVEKNIARQEEIMRIAKKEADKARQEADIHKQLELDAVELKKNNLSKALSMSQYVQQLEQEVELAKAREIALEEQRALAHKEAVAKEEERVKAKTAEVLSKEEAKEAEKLELRHRSGQLYAMKKAQQHELEVKEAELRIESLKLHAQYPELQAAPLTGETAKIEVEVTPREIPERRVFDMTMQSPSTGLAEAQIEEHAPSVISSEKRAEDIAVERHEGAEKLQKKKRKIKKGQEVHPFEEPVTTGAQAQDVSSEPVLIPISSPSPQDVGGEVDTAKPIPISSAPPEGVEKTKKKNWVARMINK